MRPLDAGGEVPPGATCDAGDCDKPVAALRYDAYGHGWLPVCTEHAKSALW